MAPTTGPPDPTVCTVLRYLPAILSYVIETNLSPKLQFLTKRMGRDPAVEQSEFLHYVTFSLEGRIRLRVCLVYFAKFFYKGILVI